MARNSEGTYPITIEEEETAKVICQITLNSIAIDKGDNRWAAFEIGKMAMVIFSGQIVITRGISK
jgi:hypothetical protein